MERQDHPSIRRKTSDLETLLSRSDSLEGFLEKGEGSFVESDFISLLGSIFEEKQLTKANLAKRSGISEVYVHQLFGGRRTPSRDRLLCLCIGMGASLKETQELLRRNKDAMLYARSRRDAVIEYGILHRMDLYQVNDMLFKNGEKTLI